MTDERDRARVLISAEVIENLMKYKKDVSVAKAIVEVLVNSISLAKKSNKYK